MRRRRNPDFKTSDLLVIGGIAAGAYLIYQLVSKTPAAVKAVTAPVANTIASAWSKLTLGAPLQGVLGDVVLPDGTDIGPLSGMPIKNDAAGNVYILSNGTIYQLGQSDSNGNWPAQLVLDTNFGTTGSGW